MLGLLPLAAFFLLWNVLAQRGIPRPFCVAAIYWALFVFCLTETLSICWLVRIIPLVVAWIVSIAAIILLGKPVFKFKIPSWNFTLTEKFLITIIASIALIKGVSAFFSAPNTSDAMTYHLSRIEHWVQNGSVNYYPTNETRQLYSPPFAEYILLHLRILAGSDFWSNTLQWLAALGSWYVLYQMGQYLGLSRPARLLAVVVAATIPLGLVQMTSTQTDYVLTFWLMVWMVALMELFIKPNWSNAIICGVGLGAALCTKGTAYIYAPVWILIFVIASLQERKPYKMGLILAVLFVSLIFILGIGLRNTVVFGKPNWTHVQLTNKTLNPSVIAANAISNVAMNLGTPWERVNKAESSVLEKIVSALKFNRHDELLGDSPLRIGNYSTGEDDTVNPLHMVLMLISIVVLMVIRIPNKRPIFIFILGIVGMMIMFCIVLRFQIWNERFQLPIFILASLCVAAVAAFYGRAIIIVAAIGVTLCSMPWLLQCNEHPILGEHSIFKTTRMQQYFSEEPNMVVPYTLVINALKEHNCRQIGLWGENTWEYPLWPMLSKVFANDFRFEHVDIQNPSKGLSYPQGPFHPCAIIALSHAPESIEVSSSHYQQIWHMNLPQGETALFVPNP